MKQALKYTVGSFSFSFGLLAFYFNIDWSGKGTWSDVWFLFCGLSMLFWGFYFLTNFTKE